MMLAAHTYFKPLNFETEKALFLAHSIELPRFRYREYTDSKLSESDDRLVKTASLVRRLPTASHVEAFRDLNEKLYGKPSGELGRGILTNIHSKVDSPMKETLWKEVEQRLHLCASMLKPYSLSVVGTEVFMHYKKHFRRYSKAYFEGIDLRRASLSECIAGAIEITGLGARGWSLLEEIDSSHARVNYSKKKVIFGRHYMVRTMGAKARIAVHEVYGHALRGKMPSIRESEGFAIVLEQLLGDELKHRRAYRYLVGVLAHQPMSFREVFEILWRVMVIASNYPEESARSHAFNECVRIFRGGLTDNKGAVFLKDIVYFEANLKMWEVLSQELLSYQAFVDMIEGRRVVYDNYRR